MHFSVIIPVYNEIKTIRSLLLKLVKGHKNYIKEIFVIDSGSSDGSDSEVLKLAGRYNIIKLVRIKKSEFNHGLTRNYGVRLSCAKYVCFLSGDAIPKSKNIFRYFLEDFETDKKVVAVFGKQVCHESTFLIQKIEYKNRFETLDKYANSLGVLVFDLIKPFITYELSSRFLWYSLFDTFSCYKRSYLIDNPFPKVDYGEDLLQGKKIVESGFVKIYDLRCEVYHSHSLSISDYYEIQKRDFSLSMGTLRVKRSVNIFKKVHKVWNSDFNYLAKLYYTGVIIFYYLVKLTAFVEVKYFQYKKQSILK